MLDLCQGVKNRAYDRISSASIFAWYRWISKCLPTNNKCYLSDTTLESSWSRMSSFKVTGLKSFRSDQWRTSYRSLAFSSPSGFRLVFALFRNYNKIVEADFANVIINRQRNGFQYLVYVILRVHSYRGRLICWQTLSSSKARFGWKMNNGLSVLWTVRSRSPSL